MLFIQRFVAARPQSKNATVEEVSDEDDVVPDVDEELPDVGEDDEESPPPCWGCAPFGSPGI